MAGLPTNQRDQMMLLVAIVGIAGAGLFYQFWYSKQSEALAGTRAHVEKLDASNQRARAILSRGNVQQLQEESKRLQANLDLMRTLIPTSNEVPALLDQIIGAARRTGLDFSNFTPSATVAGDAFDTHRVRMSVQGSYHQIGELLAAIGSLRRIIVPVNVSLAAATGRNVRATRPDEQMLTANFDIQTYVAKAVSEEEP